MTKRKTSTIAAGLLATTLLAASPMLMAGNHSEHDGDSYRGKHHDKTEMCENMREGKGPFNKEERQEKMAEKREAMAERLKLNDEQRGIWNEIHEERRQQHEKRMEKMMEEMEKRCDQSKE
ncbi:hypothetical protein SAMN05216369_1512 [Marinobacter antarcticus]|uniref:Uncharacterized protein n=1 Tax=Marinobacter antarcticus TaxID=564117 RepID=A0A1M6RHI3_9GAMM|nr:hypothetical protein [Marinobacter antarcticus]SHK31893.1 hypothetical protein SAMN05216369_1512 [Marinobacter antarcticus]